MPKKSISLEKNFAGNFYHHQFIGIHALTSKLVFSGHMS